MNEQCPTHSKWFWRLSCMTNAITKKQKIRKFECPQPTSWASSCYLEMAINQWIYYWIREQSQPFSRIVFLLINGVRWSAINLICRGVGCDFHQWRNKLKHSSSFERFYSRACGGITFGITDYVYHCIISSRAELCVCVCVGCEKCVTKTTTSLNNKMIFEMCLCTSSFWCEQNNIINKNNILL